MDYLTDTEKLDLVSHVKQAMKCREDAAMYARWRKQIIDRAKRRLKAAENARV